jgi:hypothetical protein
MDDLQPVTKGSQGGKMNGLGAHVAIGAAGFARLTDWVDLWRLISAYKNKMRAICPKAIYES